MSVLVSILIPAYNAEPWIQETLRSALAQTYPHTEIIVVDDGSSDRTCEIVRAFGSDRIRLVSQPNQGAAAARNHAFALSQGEYIQWLDADDLLVPEKIQLQMAAAARDRNPRIIYSGGFARFFYRTKNARFVRTSIWETLSPLEWMTRKMEQNLYMQTATWLVHRDVTAAAGPWDTRLLGDDDGEYFARVLLQGEFVHFVEGANIHYRISGGQQLSYIGRSDRKLDAQFLSMTLNIGYIRSLDDSARVRSACLRYLQTWFFYFYPNRPDLVGKLSAIAGDLGGALRPPTLSWKYRWIQKVFGWKLTKNAQRLFPVVRWGCVRIWDKLHHRLIRQTSRASLLALAGVWFPL